MKEKKLNDILTSLRRTADTMEITYKLSSLKEDFNNITKPAILEYAPVKIVACFEEYFRQLYKAIIDEPKFRKNLRNIKGLQESKMNLDVIDVLQNGILTLGDYFSYYFPCSSIENINANFSNLLGIPFFKALKENVVEDDKGKNKNRAESIIASIDEIFKIRHTLCHEASITKSLTLENVNEMIDNANSFVEHISRVVYYTLYPDAPETQAEMNEVSNRSFMQAETELSLLIKKIKEQTKDTDFPENFEYLESWEAYRDSRAKDEASSFEGGTIYPLIYSGSLEKTTRLLITELKKKYRIM